MTRHARAGRFPGPPILNQQETMVVPKLLVSALSGVVGT